MGTLAWQWNSHRVSSKKICNRIILVTPYISILEVARYKYFQNISGNFIPDKFDNLSKSYKLDLPTLIIGAGNDNLTPVFMARKLSENIKQSVYIESVAK